jgi:hypothetical protein
MKIWFDLSNSPHINLFAQMIRELEADGHEVVITCRPLANTIDLLDLHGFRYEVVGEHYGANFYRKLFGYPIRVMQLRRYLAPKRIDVAISQSSFHSPVVARLLGVRSIYMNDNEHALGNVPSFLSANKIMVPEFLSLANLKRQMASPAKVERYSPREASTSGGCKSPVLNGVQANRKASGHMRPGALTAQYYKAARTSGRRAARH